MTYLKRLCSFAISVLQALAIFPTTVVAGGTCICVEHVPTEQTLRGCRLSQSKNDFHPTALHCRANDAPGDADTHAPITIDDTVYRVVPAGQGRCDPCDPAIRPGDTVPRSDDDGIESAGDGK